MNFNIKKFFNKKKEYKHQRDRTYKHKKKVNRNEELVLFYVESKSTLEAVGKKFNITRERARQIISLSLNKEQYTIIKKENRKHAVEECRRKKMAKDMLGRKCVVCGKQLFKYCTIVCSEECKDLHKKAQNKKKLVRVKKWQQSHPEKIKEYNDKGYLKMRLDPEKVKAYNKKITAYIKNRRENEPGYRERLNAQARKWQRENKDKLKTIHKKWYEGLKADPIRYAAYKEKCNRNYQKNKGKNKEKRRAASKKWQEKNKEKLKVTRVLWYKKLKEDPIKYKIHKEKAKKYYQNNK